MPLPNASAASGADAAATTAASVATENDRLPVGLAAAAPEDKPAAARVATRPALEASAGLVAFGNATARWRAGDAYITIVVRAAGAIGIG